MFYKVLKEKKKTYADYRQAKQDKLDSNNTRFSFDELINEMIADAWYMVTEYHLRLGPLGITDNLEEVVKHIYKKR